MTDGALAYELDENQAPFFMKLQNRPPANIEARNSIEAALTALKGGLDFSTLYLTMKDDIHRPFALMPITLTEEEVAELEEIEARPSPLIGRHLRSIPQV